MNYGYLLIIVLISLISCGGSDSSGFVTVYKSTGAIQCESSGVSFEDSAQVLIENGIDVIESNCGFLTNLSVPTVCGAGTTGINLHQISRTSLQDVENLGYTDVSTLANETTGSGYQVVEC